MTKTTLAISCAVGAVLWALILTAIHSLFGVSWCTLGTSCVKLVGLVVVVALIYGEYLLQCDRYNERVRARAAGAERRRAEDARVVERQRRLLAIADLIESAPEHEKQRLQREAEALGFLDEEQGPQAA